MSFRANSGLSHLRLVGDISHSETVMSCGGSPGRGYCIDVEPRSEIRRLPDAGNQGRRWYPPLHQERH